SCGSAGPRRVAWCRWPLSLLYFVEYLAASPRPKVAYFAPGALASTLGGLQQVVALLLFEHLLVAREDGLYERHELQDLRHRALGLHLALGERHRDVDLAQPE